MARPAVAFDPAIEQEFSKMRLSMGEFKGFLQLNLAEDAFRLELSGSGPGNTEDVWADMAATLTDNSHSFFIFRSTLERSSEKFVLMHWGPDLAPVKQRMLYASSRQSLKDYLGSADFVDDYFVATPEEMTAEAFHKDRVLVPQIDVRSMEEIEKEEAELECAPTATRTAVMAAMGVTMADELTALLQQFAQEEVDCILLTLDTKSQAVSGEAGDADLDGWLGALNPEEPKYVVLRYRHIHNDEEKCKILFFYYCPDNADRRDKFTYSTCKAHVISSAESAGFAIDFRFEFVDLPDINQERLIQDMYPVREEQKMLDRPTGPARKKPRTKRRNKRALLAAS